MKTGMTIEEMAKEIQTRDDMKQDFVVPTSLLEMRGGKNLGFNVEDDERSYEVTPYAHSQIADRLKIPRQYYRRMQEESPELLDRNVNHWFQEKVERRMVRCRKENGNPAQARAFVSDRFRTWDDIIVARAALPVLGELRNDGGLDIQANHLTDTRLYIQATTPRLEAEIRTGDVVQAGIQIRNSEVGSGTFAVEEMIWRLVCSNGMISGTALRKYHVGKRMGGNGDDIQEFYRDETIQAELKAFTLKVQDTVRHAFDSETFDNEVRTLRTAAGDEFKPKELERVVTDVTKRLSLPRLDDILTNVSDSGDLTRYGLAQAVTALAHETEDADQAYEFEKAGGKIIQMKPATWSQIAEA